ncbi:threonine synthase [Membranihabitans marinus]
MTQLTMGEGNTPLLRSDRISKKYNIPNLYFKLETSNPTGSYKDRYAASAISHLMLNKSKLCLATSSGNTGAALAAYCARANMPCYIVVVDGAPAGKLNQMRLYGAETLMVKGFGKDEEISKNTFDELKAFALSMNSQVQISAYAYSPEGMQGVESIAFEIAEELPEDNVKVFSPSGGGGLTLAVGRGFLKWKEKNKEYSLPALHCVQPEGNNTIAGPLKEKLRTATAISKSVTKVSGLQVPNIIDGNQTIELCNALHGDGHLVTDEEIFKIQGELARLEGIYCEPAGAVALAGAIRARSEGLIKGDQHIVCLITGHGFKDETSIDRMVEKGNPFFENIEKVKNYILHK